MEISLLHPQERPVWDEFVTCCAGAVPFHYSAWQEIMEKEYGLVSWYLMARSGGEVEGVLPLFQIGSRLVGRVVMSMPGGLCVVNAAAGVALLEYATGIAARAGARSLVIRDSRQRVQCANEWREDHRSYVCELPADSGALNKQLSRQLRQHVRKAYEGGIETEVVPCPEAADDFYTVFSELLHEKGVPVFSRSFLQGILDRLKGQYSVAVARLAGQPVGAMLLFRLGDALYAVWGGSPARHRDTRATHALWWAAMEHGVQQGCHSLDMGRSQVGSGSDTFKSRWGGTPVPIYQLSLSLARGAIRHQPDTSTLSYRLFTRTWQRLPRSVVQYLGPRLRRYVPFG